MKIIYLSYSCKQVAMVQNWHTLKLMIEIENIKSLLESCSCSSYFDIDFSSVGIYLAFASIKSQLLHFR